MAGPVKNVAQAAARVDAIFIPDSGDDLPDVVQTLTANGVNTKKVQLLGTGLWDDPRIYSVPAVDGGWYAAPDSAGYRNFAQRYRARYKQDPVRTARAHRGAPAPRLLEACLVAPYSATRV
jgi:branched-chain amino acid transport system substrate-binding protein